MLDCEDEPEIAVLHEEIDKMFERIFNDKYDESNEKNPSSTFRTNIYEADFAYSNFKTAAKSFNLRNSPGTAGYDYANALLLMVLGDKVYS